MPSPRFPATATLLDAKRCPLDKFDALFTKITQERRIRDGYFRHNHPEETRFLFVVNGSPYGSGRVVGETCDFLEVHEFFTAYAGHPESPLSFFVADKRLLLGLMVLFRYEPVLTFKTQLVDVLDILETLAERNADQILAVRSECAWALSLSAKGRPVMTFLPLGAGEPAGTDPAEQLATYALGRVGDMAVDVYEETRVGPAGDVILVTPETRGHLVDVFLRVAAKVQEEEAAASPAPKVTPQEALTPAMEAPSHPSSPDALHMENGPPILGEPVGGPLKLETPGADERVAGARRPEETVVPQAMATSEPTDVSSHLPPGDVLPLEEPPRAWTEAETSPLELEGFAVDERVTGAPSPEETTIPRAVVPELLLFVGDKQLGAFSLASGEATIGRTPTNTIVIDNAGVSRRHAVVRVKEDKVILEDLGSANGTFIRGQKIQEHELKDGDEIVIVKHRLVFRIPKEEETPTKAEPVADVGQQTMYIDSAAIAQAVGSRFGARPEAIATTLRPRLILPDLKKFALEEDEVSMGSGTSCQIPLSGMFVGRLHAKIVRTKEGQFKIQHVSGLAGTRVNGEKISEHLLKHGDEIEIGKQRLLFRLER